MAVALLAAVTMSGCGVGTVVILGIVIGSNEEVQDALELKEEDRVIFNYLDEFCTIMEYNGDIYYLSPAKFCVGEPEEYVEVGWMGQRWRYNLVYGDAHEKPTFLFIYNSNTYFINESFDYMAEEFTIENTYHNVIYGKDFIKSNRVGIPSDVDTYEITLTSINCPTLKFKFSVFKEEGVWYAYSGPLFAFELSSGIVTTLFEAGIIPNE